MHTHATRAHLLTDEHTDPLPDCLTEGPTDMRSIIFVIAMSAAVVGVHFTPNHYCQAVFGLPCDIHQ